MARQSRTFLTAGLLMATGLLANGHPAVAQASDPSFGCPRNMPTMEPTVVEPTAGDVDSGSGTLKAFVLAVKQYILTSSPVHATCLMKKEAGPLRSSSTYIVRLTPDGRIHTHAKSMGLSGRKLKTDIYRQILQGLGINAANNLVADLTTAASGDGGSFAINGDNGYAAVYLRRAVSSLPYVLVAGFDLNESHVMSFDEDQGIKHVTTSITAKDVVNRDTLKAFVIEAGRFYKEITEREGVGSASAVRLAMRDPDGPWRDVKNSIYIYIWDLERDIILFHAGFPDRYELQRLEPQAVNKLTGNYVLDELKALLEKDEEGFLDYSFDDPDTGEKDVLKTGYVREFTAKTPSNNTVKFVVGSGFYPRPTDKATVGEGEVIEAVAPQIMRSVTANSVDAVSGRISSGLLSAPSAAFSIGGASTLTGALQASVQDLADGSIDLDRLLANSSFTMPFNVADSNDGGVGESSPFGSFTFWGSGDYRSMSGGTAESVDYDGGVTSASLGIDTRLGADVLAGVALLWSQGEVNYKVSGASGEITTRLLGVHPYLGWQVWDGMDLWSMAGYGIGKMKIDDKSGDSQENDMSQRMFAAGVKGTLASSDQLIAGGTTSLNVKGEVAFTWADVEADGSVEDMALAVGRQRLVVEGAHARKLDSGATFTPSLEVGVRNDSGDGETGTGAEVGGALRYEGAGSRLIVEGRVRHLLSHSGDMEETGVSALVRIKPGGAGRGLALAVEPSWGETASSVQHLWESGISAGASGGNQAHLNAEVGYGFDAPRGLGVVTPYTGLALTGEGGQSWRMGARWQVSEGRSVSLEGTRHDAANDNEPTHGLTLRGALRW